MKDSNMTDEWIARQWKNNPCVRLENGDIRTGPLRLSFPNLLKPGKATKSKPDGQWGSVLLFPPRVDLSLLYEERGRVAKENWPNATKLFNPIRDQDIDGHGQPGEAAIKAGYEKGSMRISANANGKVLTVDPRGAPIVDPTKIYPGVWAICTLRCYPFEKDGNKGPTFGLQAVMIIADDETIGGNGPVNVQQAFAGVNIEAGDINADAAFGGGAVDPFS